MGLGGVAASQRQGNIDNTFLLPGYVRMDMFAVYSFNVEVTH
jgi:iron complex outermembrane recepter protein